jgi:hypothetical protein
MYGLELDSDDNPTSATSTAGCVHRSTDRPDAGGAIAELAGSRATGRRSQESAKSHAADIRLYDQKRHKK